MIGYDKVLCAGIVRLASTSGEKEQISMIIGMCTKGQLTELSGSTVIMIASHIK